MNKKHQLFLAEQQKKAAKPVVEETVVDELVEEAKKEEPETVRSLREQKFDDLSVETYVKEDLHQED